MPHPGAMNKPYAALRRKEAMVALADGCSPFINTEPRQRKARDDEDIVAGVQPQGAGVPAEKRQERAAKAFSTGL
jgi:hypothetical protein